VKEQEFDYINIIPFVDIMLVLLTIVLTSSTFVATGVIPIELPRAMKSGEIASRAQTIEIDRKGSLFLNAKSVSIEDWADTSVLLIGRCPCSSERIGRSNSSLL
jgi:biopolymer transport protein ExbD